MAIIDSQTGMFATALMFLLIGGYALFFPVHIQRFYANYYERNKHRFLIRWGIQRHFVSVGWFPMFVRLWGALILATACLMLYALAAN
jgi:hypothetical protein